MYERGLLRLLAGGRVAIGAALVLAPSRGPGRSWVGGEAQRPATQVIARALGARDVALGAGALAALARGQSVRPWLLGGALADVVDAVSTATAGDAVPLSARRGVTAVAVGSALQHVWLATRLD